MIASVCIPACLRGFATSLPPGQAFDITLAGGLVERITPVQTAPQGILLSALVDSHVHIDKTFTIEEVGAVNGDLFAAIDRMAAHRAGWTAEKIRARMERALLEAWRHGTRAMRTHIDWSEADTVPLAWGIAQTLRHAWQGKVELQFVSLTPLDVFADAAAGQAIASVVQRSGGILGAFIYRNADLEAKLDALFSLAVQYGLDIDLHVDEGLDVEACGLHTVAQLTQKFGWQGRVVCGHVCSLSVQPDAQALATLALCAQADVHIVSLPTTNLYLQGAWNRTPIERGITRLMEAAAHGIRPSLATDNVADAFYPYGCYDLVEAFQLGVQMAHLPAPLGWLDTITRSPARALRLAWDGTIAEGCPADLVLLQAKNGYELLSPAGRQRTVIRAGQVLDFGQKTPPIPF